MTLYGVKFIPGHRRPSLWKRVRAFFRIFGLAIGVAALGAWVMMALLLVIFGYPCNW